jgi:hypothetical protein
MEGTQTAPDLVTQAKAHYELGMTAYSLGHYDRAVDSFTKAYDLDPAPVLLYNIAQAHWKKGNPEQAVAYYKRYLEADPNAQNRARIKNRIRELEAEMKEHPRPMPAVDPKLPDLPSEPAPTPSKSASVPAPTAPQPRAPAPTTGTTGTALSVTPPEPRPKEGEAVATAPRLPPAGTSPYWQPPDSAEPAPAAGKPAPMSTAEVMPPVAPTDVVSERDQPPPLYRRPWFWAGVGGVAVLAVASIFLLRPDQRGWSCGAECVSTRVVP